MKNDSYSRRFTQNRDQSDVAEAKKWNGRRHVFLGERFSPDSPHSGRVAAALGGGRGRVLDRQYLHGLRQCGRRKRGPHRRARDFRSRVVRSPHRGVAWQHRHAELYRQRREQLLRGVPRGGPFRRNLQGFLLRQRRQVSSRADPELGRWGGAWTGCQEGSRQLRVRLLPDLPRGGIFRRRVGSFLLHLPRRQRAASGQAVAFDVGNVHPRHHRSPERAGLCAVSRPGILEQPCGPSGHARPGGDAARMLQQHAVPRRGDGASRAWGPPGSTPPAARSMG